ncbi:MAG: hypothetical protein AABW84_02240 [Nanoarchaeota archaeon]
MYKRGVTRPILIIGMIVIAVIVIVLGVQIFSPLFKTLPEYLAFDQKLTVETLLAAPETAQQKLTINKDTIILGSAGYVRRKQTCVNHPITTATTLGSTPACFDLVYISGETLSFEDITIREKTILVKEYNEETRRNTFRGVS